ncbi:polymorphic toxin-type HINT domain-containing protein [Streptosporangium sp. CA-115845]|uniref:polymorphic toxin-type HINT domain-containing protein n=1 Tax=Streptosporangium sp. CA-115845 TaxID=3240071 RepID=UPI003D9370A5
MATTASYQARSGISEKTLEGEQREVAKSDHAHSLRHCFCLATPRLSVISHSRVRYLPSPNLTVAPVVNAAGPPLSVVRSYNSMDPRRDGAFGAGWSTRFDMRIVPETIRGFEALLVTYPDGRTVRFADKGDGIFQPPPGTYATLATVTGGGWRLMDKSSTTYLFDAQGRLLRATDSRGRSQELTYGTDGKLSEVTATGGRSLSFTWTGDHVTTVSTSPVNGAPLTWTYSYTGDRLTEVCAPTTACTGFEYGAGSLYRSSVQDADPFGYWRLGEASGNAADLGWGAGPAYYSEATRGRPGALAGSTDTAVDLTSSGYVELPAGLMPRIHQRGGGGISCEDWNPGNCGRDACSESIGFLSSTSVSGCVPSSGDDLGNGTARPRNFPVPDTDIDPDPYPDAPPLPPVSCSPSDPNSFVPGTKVLMADGTTKPIEDVEVGDWVVAADAATGLTAARRVSHLITGDGEKHLVRITIAPDKTTGKSGTLVATDGHPFWVPDLRKWVKAGELQPGMLLRTSAGTYVQLTAIKKWTATQRVHNLTVDGLHTYHVLAGNTPVLVHNAPIPPGSLGVVYLRTDQVTGKEYVGQAGSWDRYLKRQKEHAKKLPNARFTFEVLGRATYGTDLDVLEESWIRAGGGPSRNAGSALSNDRVQMNDNRYKAAGGGVC